MAQSHLDRADTFFFKNAKVIGRTRTHGSGAVNLQREHRRGARNVWAFSLVELSIAIGIIAVLTTLVIVGWPKILASSETARCMENMRSLHISLNSYVQDIGHWPQVPEEIDVSSDQNDSEYEDWWLNELKNYGATEEVWRCPTIKRTVSNKKPNGRPKLTYTPTPFDNSPFTPYRWSSQPWLVETGNMHGNGALLCFPDGSIKTIDDVVPSLVR